MRRPIFGRIASIHCPGVARLAAVVYLCINQTDYLRRIGCQLLLRLFLREELGEE
jgi:hypothetical protein